MVLQQYITNNYLRAGIILIGLLILLRILVSIAERIILRFVSKTQTDLDDIIIEKSSKPLTLILFFISLKIALFELNISDVFVTDIEKIIYTSIVLVVCYLFYVLIDIVVFRVWNKVARKAKIGVAESLSSLIHGILKVSLIAVALLYVLNIWGVNIGPLLTSLGIAGLAIALALQPAMQNIFSGMSLILDKSVGVGDVVYLDAEARGKIEKIGLRSTRLRTFDNELIIVPNSMLADSKIQNIALPEPKSRVVIPFGVAYGSEIEKVKKVVLAELKKIKNLSDEPKPVVRFLEMADSSLNFKAYFYVDSYTQRIEAIDEANTRIYNALNKNKIEIPFPQMDVHLDKG